LLQGTVLAGLLGAWLSSYPPYQRDVMMTVFLEGVAKFPALSDGQ
jgi:hypothetical protein